jgi:hypothetical protein
MVAFCLIVATRTCSFWASIGAFEKGDGRLEPYRFFPLGRIRTRTGAGRSGDISGVLADVNRLLDDSIAADGFRIAEMTTSQQPSVIDLTKIDFETLAKRFAKSNTKNVELEQLKVATRSQLDKLVR